MKQSLTAITKEYNFALLPYATRSKGMAANKETSEPMDYEGWLLRVLACVVFKDQFVLQCYKRGYRLRNRVFSINSEEITEVVLGKVQGIERIFLTQLQSFVAVDFPGCMFIRRDCRDVLSVCHTLNDKFAIRTNKNAHALAIDFCQSIGTGYRGTELFPLEAFSSYCLQEQYILEVCGDDGYVVIRPLENRHVEVLEDANGGPRRLASTIETQNRKNRSICEHVLYALCSGVSRLLSVLSKTVRITWYLALKMLTVLSVCFMPWVISLYALAWYKNDPLNTEHILFHILPGKIVRTEH